MGSSSAAISATTTKSVVSAVYGWLVTTTFRKTTKPCDPEGSFLVARFIFSFHHNEMVDAHFFLRNMDSKLHVLSLFAFFCFGTISFISKWMSYSYPFTATASWSLFKQQPGRIFFLNTLLLFRSHQPVGLELPRFSRPGAARSAHDPLLFLKLLACRFLYQQIISNKINNNSKNNPK